MIHRDKDWLVLEPVRRKNLLHVHAGLAALGADDKFPDIESALLPVKDIDL